MYIGLQQLCVNVFYLLRICYRMYELRVICFFVRKYVFPHSFLRRVRIGTHLRHLQRVRCMCNSCVGILCRYVCTDVGVVI